MDISLYLVRKQWILGAQSKTSSYFVLHGLVCTHPSTAANLPCLPGSSVYAESLLLSSRLSITRVSAQLLYRVMPSGIYSCRLLAHSLYVLLLTFFLPATALSVDVFLLHSDFYTSSYRGWSQHSSILYSNAQTNHDILLPDIFMLPLQFPALRYHSASSDHHNLHLLSVSCRRS